MTKNNEVFSLEEIKILEKKKELKEITPEEYQKLLEIKKADISLEWLENDSNKTIEEKVEKKIKLIKEHKKNILEQAKSKVEKTKKDIETKVDKKVEEVTDKVTEAVLEKTGIGAMWEKVSWMFDKISWVFDTFWKKITAMFAWTALGGWLGFEASSDDESTTVENEEDESTEKNQNKLKNKWKVKTKEEPNISEAKEKKKETIYWWYKLIGRKFLEKVSPSKILYNKSANNYHLVLDNIEKKWLTYSEILEIRKDFITNSWEQNITERIKRRLWIDKKLDITSKKLLWIIDVIAGSNAHFIIKNNLSNIDNIIEDNKFQKRFWNTYDYLKWKKFWELNFNEIEFLLWYTMPIAILWKFTSILPKKDELESYKKIIDEEIENRKKWFFWKDFLTIIWNWFNQTWLLKDSIINKKFKEKIKSYDEKKQKDILNDLSKFNAFKNSVLSQISTPKFSLNLPNFENDFKNKLIPTKIFELYLLFDGKTNLSNLSWTNKMLMYLWISKIPKDTTLWNKYLQELILNNNSSNKNYLSEEEKSFIIPLLEQAWYKFILEKSIKIASDIKNATQTIIIKKLFEENGIDIKQEKYEYIDYIILASLFWLTFATTKLPIPIHIKIVLSAAMSSFWTTYLVWILKEHWVFSKMLIDETLPEEIRETLKKFK